MTMCSEGLGIINKKIAHKTIYDALYITSYILNTTDGTKYKRIILAQSKNKIILDETHTGFLNSNIHR